jgi:hypothetical protein
MLVSQLLRQVALMESWSEQGGIQSIIEKQSCRRAPESREKKISKRGAVPAIIGTSSINEEGRRMVTEREDMGSMIEDTKCVLSAEDPFEYISNVC